MKNTPKAEEKVEEVKLQAETSIDSEKTSKSEKSMNLLMAYIAILKQIQFRDKGFM